MKDCVHLSIHIFIMSCAAWSGDHMSHEQNYVSLNRDRKVHETVGVQCRYTVPGGNKLVTMSVISA